MTKKESLATKYPEIAKEWNYKKNGNFKPEHIAPKKRKKYGGNALNVDMNG